eukprot:1520381-Amphidinium_carterae.1
MESCGVAALQWGNIFSTSESNLHRASKVFAAEKASEPLKSPLWNAEFQAEVAEASSKAPLQVRGATEQLRQVTGWP